MGRGNPALGGWGEGITSAENLLEFDSPEPEDRKWITSWVISLLVTARELGTLKLQQSPGHLQCPQQGSYPGDLEIMETSRPPTQMLVLWLLPQMLS